MTARPDPVTQFRTLMEIAKTTFSPDRYAKLETMYEHFADRIIVAPASGKAEYHNAFQGGYLDHILNVITAIRHVSKAAVTMGIVIDFTKEEAIFSAMHHDLGKLGDLTEPYFLPQESAWHRENRGELYTKNPKLPWMTVTDRALFLLQHFGVVITSKEWRAIKVSDGLYEEGNKSYFINYGWPQPKWDTSLPYLLHWSDHMATLGEKAKGLAQTTEE